MKKINAFIALSLALIMILAAAACTSPTPGSAQGEDRTAAPEETVGPIGEPTGQPEQSDADINLKPDPEWRFYRVDYSETAAALTPRIITSVEQFESEVLPEIENSRSSKADPKELVEELKALYNEEFFKTGHLVTFYMTYGSGSIRPEVASVDKVGDRLVIKVTGKMDGDVGTCDMATHFGIVALDNRLYPADLKVEIPGAGASRTAEG